MIVAECYFLDVGQGASQVINLGDGSAIVIDCGASYQVLGDLLDRRLKIKRIAALILSHNHNDHIGGVPGLIRRYRKKIDSIFFLQDQPASDQLGRKCFDLMASECEKGYLPDPIPLIKSTQNRWLYGVADETDSLRLEILYPTFFANLRGQNSGSQNNTCGILLLHCGQKRVLFTGDAEIDVWKSINKERDGLPLKCDVMSMPHHGGQIVRHKRPDESYDELHEAIREDLEWLYSEALTSEIVVVSVGTNNGFPDQHPLPPQIQSAKKSGACVMCTQITPRCSDDVNRLLPGVLSSGDFPGKSRLKNTDVGCAGTVVVHIGPNELSVDRWNEHQDQIAAKLCEGPDHPLCR